MFSSVNDMPEKFGITSIPCAWIRSTARAVQFRMSAVYLPKRTGEGLFEHGQRMEGIGGGKQKVANLKNT